MVMLFQRWPVEAIEEKKLISIKNNIADTSANLEHGLFFVTVLQSVNGTQFYII